jgi:putative transposase
VGDEALTGEKKVKGRKRHVLVDTQGHLLSVLVTPADLSDRDGLECVLTYARPDLPRLTTVWADQSYHGEEFTAFIRDEFDLTLDIVPKRAGQRTFVVLPKRWVVERSLGWFGRYRRLSKDYERETDCSESWLYLASIHLLTKRLARAA